MRRPSYAQLVEQLREKDRTATLLGQALQDVVNREIAAVDGVFDEEDSYQFSLLRPTSPCGGIILITFRHPGQKDHVSAHYADDLIGSSDRVQHQPRCWWPALERLADARRQAERQAG